jgi:hypothetical protein
MEDAVWEALTRALSGEYEILARLGLGSGGAPVYLARELVTDNLVALRLPPLVSGNEAQEYGLEVVRQLDASLPEIETRCSHCAVTLRQWSRFCTNCGRDISGMAPGADGQTRDQLRALAREAAAGTYEILGEMARAEGGGLVYFAREIATGRVLGLQLEAGPESTLVMTATQFAASDPSIEIPEARLPPVGEPLPRRVSVPRGVGRSSFPGSPPLSMSSGSNRLFVVGGIVLLLVVAAFATCRVL